MFWGAFYPGLQGFESRHDELDMDVYRTYMPNVSAFTDEGKRPPESEICTGKIKHKGSTYIEQWNFLKNSVSPDLVKGCKLTLPAPELYHLRYAQGKAYPTDVYRNDQEFFADIAKAYQTELQILYDHGLRNAQIDDPNLACMLYTLCSCLCHRLQNVTD